MEINKVSSRKPFTFNKVEMEEALVEDLVQAERVCGKSEGFEFSAAVVSQICSFDGVKVPVEEVRRMRKDDFLELSAAINGEEPPPATAPGT